MNKKIDSLRVEMKKQGIDGFFVPRADEFQNEYVPPSADRLVWLTGFDGSAGSAIVLQDKAAFFTDGRYTLQARGQVDAGIFEICSVSPDQPPLPTLTPAQWIEKNLTQSQVFGIDPWLHTSKGAKSLREAVEKAGGVFRLLDANPLDSAWFDRPQPPLTPCVPHPLQFSGVDSAKKRGDLAAILREKGAGALTLMLPEEICWLFNVRGGDIPFTPFPLSYAVAYDDATADWFIDARKITAETRAWVGNSVRIHSFEAFSTHLESLARRGVTLWIDPASAPVKVQDIILSAPLSPLPPLAGGEDQGEGGREDRTGFRLPTPAASPPPHPDPLPLQISSVGEREILAERSPVQLMKARKNTAEVQGAIDAHIRDGVAETRFLAAILAPGAAEKLDEISASDLLEKFRSEGEHFKGLSFHSISGAGGNGAIVHYHATPQSNKPLLAGPIYLIDSGAQYLDGTTDITRTVAVDRDKITAEMKDRFTRVLKGHIQVALAVFAEGETGETLDVKARAALKDIGLDYAHGTGHGVGSYLSVHEGPHGISSSWKGAAALEPGMIVSNEPGYYKEGEYGIRIENLVVVVDTGERDAADKRLLGFKTLTQAPFDPHLIDTGLLDDAELQWLNDYHAGVRNTLLSLLEKKYPEAAEFLTTATQPLAK